MPRTKIKNADRRLIQAWVPSRDYEVLVALATREGTSISELVRRQVRVVTSAHQAVSTAAS